MIENATQESQNVETNETEPQVKTGVKAGKVSFEVSLIEDDIVLIPVHL
jgi:hypothetical protein